MPQPDLWYMLHMHLLTLVRDVADIRMPSFIHQVYFWLEFVAEVDSPSDLHTPMLVIDRPTPNLVQVL